jgi:hypothetical protein
MEIEVEGKFQHETLQCLLGVEDSCTPSRERQDIPPVLKLFVEADPRWADHPNCSSAFIDLPGSPT